MLNSINASPVQLAYLINLYEFQNYINYIYKCYIPTMFLSSPQIVIFFCSRGTHLETAVLKLKIHDPF
jgi:hypothetical protein